MGILEYAMKVVGLGIVATVIIVVIKQQRPEFAVQLSLLVGIMFFTFIIGKVNTVIVVFNQLAQRANINMYYMGTVLKIIGIAYVSEFGAQICRDAGEGAIASKIEFVAKVLIMVMAIPIIIAVFDTLMKIIP
ncbi:stage III sporulation protein AD [Thermincola ferriacetica]|uniref:Stage III sporulation protein AD n=1 Tax=Thermincola ferriacetica TaxID=281456 RepID=A0A0L6W5G5_9FIRM|nr:stage III sporulation protein AD [Thermincola ferriacetica]KNZ70711.1 stage III sporulation protein AD [Thermincola ferriacetica]